MKKRTEQSVRILPLLLTVFVAVALAYALFPEETARFLAPVTELASGVTGQTEVASSCAALENASSGDEASEDVSPQETIIPPEITRPGISQDLILSPPVETVVETSGDPESIYQYSGYYSPVEEGHNNALVIEAQIVRLVNDAREKAGLSSLIFDSDLANSAAIRARELSESFSHIRPDGSEYFTSFPPRYALMGENLADANGIISDTDFASACITYWMDLESHRDNILNPEFTLTGVGVHIINGHMYAVQLFGEPESLY